MKAASQALLIFISMAVLFTLSSCELVTSSDDLSGTYSYSGYTENLTLIVSGSMELEINDDAEITGSWEFSAVTPADDIGPQIGRGELIGVIEDSVIMINLNPQNADNNVMLIGGQEGNNITGNWQYVGFQGVINEGKFEATKQN
ncbi:hypothetical protein ACFLR4_01595 [Bacteroidota bacterium]